jgi:hypothetical protein
VPPLLYGNHNCRLPSRAQGLGRVTVFQPLLRTVTTKSRVVAVVQLTAASAAGDRRIRRVMIAVATMPHHGICNDCYCD